MIVWAFCEEITMYGEGEWKPGQNQQICYDHSGDIRQEADGCNPSFFSGMIFWLLDPEVDL